MSHLLPPDRYDEVRELLAGGQKIGAIKVYREATGVGLAEAKHAVEAIERAGDLAPLKPTDRTPQPPPHDRVRELLAAGKKIDAIKVYREVVGSSLKDAKDAVESIEREGAATSRPDRATHTVSKGCVGMLAAVGVAGVLVLAQLFVG